MNSCTIIIPTFNRSSSIKKLLKYIVDFQIKCPIIIADGSSSKFHRKKNILNIKKINSHLRNDKAITYFFSSSFFTKRLFLALKKVKTPFCKINADDDFFSKEYILESIQKLKIDSQLASVSGYSLSAHVYKNSLNFTLGDSSFNLGRSPIERLLNDKRNFYAWTVYKSDFLKLIMSRVVKITENISPNTFFNEAMILRIWAYVMKSYTLLKGKVSFVNCCENITFYHKFNWGKKHKIASTVLFFFTNKFNKSIIKLNLFIKKDFRLSDEKAKIFTHTLLIKDKHYVLEKNNYNFFIKILNLNLIRLVQNLIRILLFVYCKFKIMLPKDGKNLVKYLKENFKSK